MACTAPPTTTEARVAITRDQFESLDFGIKKSIRYHSKRRAYYERLDHIVKWIVAITGASAFASVVGDIGNSLSKALTAIVAMLALADLILNFGARARLHQDLYRRFSELAVEMSAIQEPTAHDIARLSAKRLALEADEPHVIDALERWCWNEEAEARGLETDKRQPLTRWQRVRAKFS